MDEEKVQTGATFVNMTKNCVIKLSHIKLADMWLNDMLPTGDSRCRDHPPSEDMVKEAIDGLRSEFGTDIHFAKDTGKWFNFILVGSLFLTLKHLGSFAEFVSMLLNGKNKAFPPKPRNNSSSQSALFTHNCDSIE